MSYKLLFICTGNYYRSRFAEMLFNSLASKSGLDGNADSRGLELSIDNIGPIYLPVILQLKRLGISVQSSLRSPLRLEIADLEKADLVIALDAAEHLPLMQQCFVEWADRIRYWNVPDLHMLGAEQAFHQIEKNITVLIMELQSQALSPEKVDSA
jgi:Protein-tyrosine-phosphatase